MTDDLKLRQWDRCWPGNINLEVAVDEAVARITDLEARLAAAVEVQDRLMSERYQHYLRAEAAEAGQAAQPVAHVDGRSYRKKPVVVKAVQWTGENLREVIAFTDGPPETKSHHAGMMWEQYEDLVRKNGLKIYTLEGKMDASPGDWIIKGVKGEFYPCKPDIFAATYDPANQPTAPVVPAEGLAAELSLTMSRYDAAAPQDDEIARLREERDRFEAALGRACQVGGTTYLVERAEKAEAERDSALAQVAAAEKEKK